MARRSVANIAFAWQLWTTRNWCWWMPRIGRILADRTTRSEASRNDHENLASPEDSVMKSIENAAVLLARIFIFVWFVPEGIEKIVHYSGTAAYMAANGVPAWLLPLVIATEVVCGILLLVGWKTRLFAFLLAGYTLLAVVLFHLYPANAAEKITQMAELVDAGGMLVLFAHGAGGFSLDAWLARRRSLSVIAAA
jgi:putative oxidoreductase